MARAKIVYRVCADGIVDECDYLTEVVDKTFNNYQEAIALYEKCKEEDRPTWIVEEHEDQDGDIIDEILIKSYKKKYGQTLC